VQYRIILRRSVLLVFIALEKLWYSFRQRKCNKKVFDEDSKSNQTPKQLWLNVGLAVLPDSYRFFLSAFSILFSAYVAFIHVFLSPD